MNPRTEAARPRVPRHRVPWPRVPWHWGAPARARVPARTTEIGPPITRTVVTRADLDSLMLWVAQLRRAPYSYDWIDNLGRRSPRRPDPSLRNLKAGDAFMYIFTVSCCGQGHVEAKMTSRIPRAIFGEVHIRYDVHDLGTARVLQYTMWLPATNLATRVRRHLLAWADLPMARKQLLTLAALAHMTPADKYDRSTARKE